MLLHNDIQLSQLQLDDYEYYAKQEVYPHSNLWGDFNFSLDGVLEFEIDQQTYLSPASYGVWIPPYIAHQAVSQSDHTTHFICFRISPELSATLAKTPKIIQITPLISLLTQRILEQRDQMNCVQHWHKLLVLFDELKTAPSFDHYLPLTQNLTIKPIVDFLLQTPHHALKLNDVSSYFAISERHLLRIWQDEFAMSISEWRNRAKLMYAMDALKQQQSSKKIALDLGYQHASAFIEFFKRYTNLTPEQFRRQRF